MLINQFLAGGDILKHSGYVVDDEGDIEVLIKRHVVSSGEVEEDALCWLTEKDLEEMLKAIREAKEESKNGFED